MIRSLYTGESGLKSHQSRMDVVGNNIANVNTVGYKASRATFADMLSQNIKGASASYGATGSTNPEQVGLGTAISSIDLMMKNGAPLATGKNTDLCLSGDGLFIVRRDNETYYTRDGAFEFDAEGNYVLPGSGHFVQGWMAKDGVIDTTAATEDIKITMGQALSPDADPNALTITGISVIESEPLPISFGGKSFTVHGVPNDGKTWRYKDDLLLGATSAQIENQDGNTATVTISPAATFEIPKGTDLDMMHFTVITKGSVSEQYPLTVNLDGNQYTAIGMDNALDKTLDWTLKAGGAMAGSNTITVTNGASDVTLTLDSPLEESIGQTQTQVTSAAASAQTPVMITFSDGTTSLETSGFYEVGDRFSTASLQSVQIDSSGVITGIYSNGVRYPVAQVAVAHFNNSAGLSKTGTSLYQESSNSGTPVVSQAGEFGTVITPGALEMSNVDVADEFANMIITQRGFQSNAKIITVGDEMIETAVNMKR